MKKLIALFLTLTCVWGLLSCNNRNMNYIIANEPNITGIVKESNDSSILIENENGAYLVSLNVENKDSMTHFSIGDEVVVYYDGNIAESYPMQINTVFAITLRTPSDRTEPEAQTEPTFVPVLDGKSLEAACAEGFIDPSKVTVLGGEWAYTADPNKFVALVSVKYTNKFDEYETAEFIMVGVFGGEIELYHCLNEHSSYTRENALQEFGAIDNQRFTLE